MRTIFKYTYIRLQGQALAWGASFAVLGWFIVFAYDAMVSQSAQTMDLLKAYPKELMAFFGDITRMLTPGGYLDSGLFSYGVVILGIFSLLVGSGLLASDEESGKLDLIQAMPVSRTALFLGRYLGLALATAVILVLTWAGCAVGLLSTKMQVTAFSLALPFLSLFAEMMLFAGLALLLSMVLPSRSAAATTTGILLIASYFITSLARVVDGLKGAAQISPLTYFQSGNAVDGLNIGWFIGLLAAAALCTAGAWWAYQRRDLRVGGVGNWYWHG